MTNNTEATTREQTAAYHTAARMAALHPEGATPRPGAFGLPTSTPPPAASPHYGDYSIPPPPVDPPDEQTAETGKQIDTAEVVEATDLGRRVQQALTRMQAAS